MVFVGKIKKALNAVSIRARLAADGGFPRLYIVFITFGGGSDSSGVRWEYSATYPSPLALSVIKPTLDLRTDHFIPSFLF